MGFSIEAPFGRPFVGKAGTTTTKADLAVLLAQVGDAWAKLISLPPVSLMLATARPGIDFAWSRYLEAHDALVTSTTYTK